jgi:hypothetical protein
VYNVGMVLRLVAGVPWGLRYKWDNIEMELKSILLLLLLSGLMVVLG